MIKSILNPHATTMPIISNKGRHMIHITYHAQKRLHQRANLSTLDLYQSITKGIPLSDMPRPIREYIAKRFDRYNTDIYRLYNNTILVYRPNTYKDTRLAKPLALITVLVLPTYLVKST